MPRGAAIGLYIILAIALAALVISGLRLARGGRASALESPVVVPGKGPFKGVDPGPGDVE